MDFARSEAKISKVRTAPRIPPGEMVGMTSCEARHNPDVDPRRATSVYSLVSVAIKLSTGFIFQFSTGTGADQGVVVTCDADVVISVGHTSETDYMVVPPESTEWYGVISTYISLSQAGADALSVTEACSDGSLQFGAQNFAGAGQAELDHRGARGLIFAPERP